MSATPNALYGCYKHTDCKLNSVKNKFYFNLQFKFEQLN